MSDINCPYCGQGQEINHDDGYGYDENVKHSQTCVNCDREFKYTTEVMYYYNPYCLNQEDHELEESPGYPGIFLCSNCEYYEVREVKP